MAMLHSVDWNATTLTIGHVIYVRRRSSLRRYFQALISESAAVADADDRAACCMIAMQVRPPIGRTD